ncbi:MAG: addiction module protein [Flavobacteriales bacterium]|nr:addiction module protein [Flavobacteriales bacterium]
MTQIMQDILKLSLSERILIVEAIWDSISEKESDIELSQDTKILLDERLASHKKNPNEGSSWDDVKSRISNQL